MGFYKAERVGEWCETASGRKFWPMDPRPEDICLMDIAVALSNLCRFGGQLNTFYSVAQHSVHCSQIVPAEFALQALFHDAAEAYLVDVPRPLKGLLIGYKGIEERTLRAIALALGKPEFWLAELPAEVKEADNRMLLTERRDLKVKSGHEWNVQAEPCEWQVFPWAAYTARDAFIVRAHELGIEIKAED